MEVDDLRYTASISRSSEFYSCSWNVLYVNTDTEDSQKYS